MAINKTKLGHLLVPIFFFLSRKLHLSSPCSWHFRASCHHHLYFCFSPLPSSFQISTTITPSPSLQVLIISITILITIAISPSSLISVVLLAPPPPTSELGFTSISKADHQPHFLSCALIDHSIFSLALGVAAVLKRERGFLLLMLLSNGYGCLLRSPFQQIWAAIVDQWLSFPFLVQTLLLVLLAAELLQVTVISSLFSYSSGALRSVKGVSLGQQSPVTSFLSTFSCPVFALLQLWSAGVVEMLLLLQSLSSQSQVAAASDGHQVEAWHRRRCSSFSSSAGALPRCREASPPDDLRWVQKTLNL